MKKPIFKIGLLIILGIQNSDAASDMLTCGFQGKPHVSFYITEGPGCGEGPTGSVTVDETDFKNKLIKVSSHISRSLRGILFPHDCETSHLGCNRINPPMCHYWGSLYGGGEIDLNSSGEWKVYLDKVLLGTVIYEEKTEDIQGAVVYSRTCRVLD